MSQTGYTPIQLYYSSTTTNVPLAANLANGELAINITDGKLFYKDNAAAVQVIGWKTTPTSAGGTGLTSYTAGDTLYYASGTTLTKLAIGTAYQAYQVNAGATAPSWQPSATSVLTAQGDLLYASGANTLARLAKNTSATRYLSNTGTTNNPAWAQIDLSNGVTGTLPAANGGTGLTAFGGTNTLLYTTSASTLSSIATANTSALITNSSGAPAWTSGATANRVLRTDGTTVSFAQVALATDVSGVLPVANSLLYYNTGTKTFSTASANVDWYSIDFGAYTGRSARVEVVFSLFSGGGGSRLWYRNSLVYETGSATLSETNLNAVNGGNGSLSFVLSGATLTVRTVSSLGGGETGRMAILVEGYEMTSSRITVL